jgi:iron complex transport system substrate-binding protein
MPIRWFTAPLAALFFGFVAAPSGAAGFVDAAERFVAIPDHIGRVMTMTPAADVLVFVLAPDKLLGWSTSLSRNQRAYLPAKYARLPVVGASVRADPAETARLAARMRPDLVIEAGPVNAQAAARADIIQHQSGIPYIVLDNSIQATPATLRRIGAMLGVGQRGDDLAKYADYAIDALRGRLLIAPADERPLVYLGRGADGLETGLAGSQAMAAIDQAGVINVAARLGRDESTRVTREQLFAWNPTIIIAEDRSFYNALLRSSAWRGLTAVTNKRVYLAPANPFGWIDDPPSVNRIIGLYWLTALFYPDQYQEDLGANIRRFYEQFYGVKLTDRQLAALLRPAVGSSRATGSQIGVPLLGAEPVPFPNAAPGLNLPAPGGRPPRRGSLPVPAPGNPP